MTQDRTTPTDHVIAFLAGATVCLLATIVPVAVMVAKSEGKSR